MTYNYYAFIHACISIWFYQKKTDELLTETPRWPTMRRATIDSLPFKGVLPTQTDLLFLDILKLFTSIPMSITLSIPSRKPQFAAAKQ